MASLQYKWFTLFHITLRMGCEVYLLSRSILAPFMEDWRFMVWTLLVTILVNPVVFINCTQLVLINWNVSFEPIVLLAKSILPKSFVSYLKINWFLPGPDQYVVNNFIGNAIVNIRESLIEMSIMILDENWFHFSSRWQCFHFCELFCIER